MPGNRLTVEFDGVSRELTTHPQISGESFQHPDDRDASQTLQHIPFFPELFKLINGSYFDQRVRMERLTNNLRLGPNQGAKLHSSFVQAAQILDVPVLPELYLSNYPMIDSYSSGLNQPSVTLSQGCLTMLSDAEIFALIGHELGHLKCQHGVNKALAAIVGSIGASGIASALPVVGGAAVYGITAGLTHWSRMAEFSGDRAALLVVQDPLVVANVIAKMSGFHKGVLSDFNFESLFQQLEDYDRYDQNALQSLVKLQKMVLDSLGQAWLPSPILRIKRILMWGSSDQYKDIMSGTYTRVPPSTPHPELQLPVQSTG